MILLNSGSYFWIILFIMLILFAKVDFAFYILVFTSVLTSISFFDIDSNSILVYHMAFLICIIKFMIDPNMRIIKLSCSKVLYVFMLWCLITIPFSNFHNNIIVHNIDGIDTYVKFSYQQFTQYFYLFIGFLTSLICNILLFSKRISIKKIYKYLTYAYVFTLTVALLQHILPVEFVNAFLRNSSNTLYNYKGSRIAGTFLEPSMLSLYCAPMCAKYMYDFFSTYKIKFFLLSILFIIVIFDNNSSSGILGIIISFILIVFIKIYKFYMHQKVSINKIPKYLFILFILGLIVIYNMSYLTLGITMLTDKLSGEGVSGSLRLSAALKHIKIGVENFLPTGFGTVRSYDLLSTWLCSIGVLGLMLYILPVISLCRKLLKSKNPEAIGLFINIVIHNIIMMISVPEYGFLSMWIYYGMGYYLVCKQKHQHT